jgi:ribosomal protein L35
MKTKKALQKRLKATKNGKVLARKAGHGHFNAKQKRTEQLKAKRTYAFKGTSKTLGKFRAK